MSTRAAAERAGVSASGLRTLVARARAAGVELYAPQAEWADSRTPLVDAQALADYLANRPGRGKRTQPPAPFGPLRETEGRCEDCGGEVRSYGRVRVWRACAGCSRVAQIDA